jgi:GH15 family glucan-1,4-alpha-glucosidase
MVAAPTTSLPEAPGGERNWDYRYSWIRDATFASRAVAAVGWGGLADASARFIARSAAGHAGDLQVLYGVGGERRLPELELDLAGYDGARPVRIGNGAADQVQRDALGEILEQAWRMHERGSDPDDDDWRFLVTLVEDAAAHWQRPDNGFWEWRGAPRRFVHSTASCWGALDCGLRLAQDLGRDVPAERWRATRDAIAAELDEHAYDEERGTYVQAIGERDLDSCALLLAHTGYVAADDPRMVSTADVLARELDRGGLLVRYDAHDGLPGREGCFLSCSFWLAELYAEQGRIDQAREVYERACETASPLGLFCEEHDPEDDLPLGNYPQALTHLSHLGAAIALHRAGA